MSRPQLRLLFVINYLYPSGGAEIQLAYLAEALVERGHRVTICCIDGFSVDAGDFTEKGIEIVALGASSKLGRLAAVPRLARLARQADVVHCTMWDASLWGRLGAVLARRPVVVADHATDRSVQVAVNGAPRAHWIERHNRLLDRFTFATVACATGQRQVLLGEGVSGEKIVHIPNGIPIDALIGSATATGVDRRALGLPEGVPIVMQVGVFRAEKNQVGALEAFAQIRETVPDAQLVFVGGGLEEAAVKGRAEELAATEWAHFLGIRRDVPGLLALADVMLLPSLADAMPMTVLEAMALGVPVIASDVGDVRAVLDSAGVCVPAGDSEAIAHECVRVLSDSALRAELGRIGRARAREFDAAVMAASYEALFEAAGAETAATAAVSSSG